ncbi:MAG: ribosome silencing factor [Candidatus Methylacidiphilales bacterium]
MKPEGLTLARLCRESALDKKAIDPVILDLRGIEGPADFFLICSGQSDPQLKAIAGAIEVSLKQDHDVRPVSVDGKMVSGWVVLDYGDVLVHIMAEAKRAYYQLEKLWGDAPRID